MRRRNRRIIYLSPQIVGSFRTQRSEVRNPKGLDEVNLFRHYMN